MVMANIFYCTMSSNSTNLDGHCKTSQFPPFSKGNPLSHIGGKYDGDRGKSKLLDPVPKSHLSHFEVPDFHFLEIFFTVMLIADNREKGKEGIILCFPLCEG